MRLSEAAEYPVTFLVFNLNYQNSDIFLHLLLLGTADTCLALPLPGCPLQMQASWVKQKNIQRATKICFSQENDPFFLFGAHSCIT